VGNLTSAALTEVSKKDPSVYKVLEIDLPDGTTVRYSRAGGGRVNSVSLGPADPKVTRWGTLTRSIGDFSGSLPAVTGSIELDDGDSAWQQIVNRFGTALKWAPVRIKQLSPNYSASDITTLFSGILEDWPKPKRKTYQLSYRCNDLWLRATIGRVPFRQDDFPAINTELLAALLPIVYGIHDSTGMPHFGAVPLYEIDTGSREYIAGHGSLEDIVRIYRDPEAGALAASFTETREVRNGRLYLVASSVTTTPAEGTQLTADVEGYSDQIDGSGTVITNPIDMLKHILVNWAYGSGYQSGAWGTVTSSGAPIDETYFTAAAAYATLKNMLASRVYAEKITVEEVIREFCVTFGMRVFWRMNGKLAIIPRTHILPSAARTWLKWDRDEFGQPSFSGGGVDGYATRALAKYCYQESVGEYQRTVEVRNMLVPASREVSDEFEFRPSLAALTS
jgi:hypothetical protein